MRLKKLEVVGFKSFASRVTLDFDEGITAIVGPNGSGKSNVSDAVRWVLGEQSVKSLRGSKMEDVIFAGSQGKRPLGMAEVVLTLDNSHGFLPIEFAEVSITRRVYRSGDSEFLINKQPCRLRDIHDLLTDTGLGREGYAIIGQGQLETVLSVRSHDRRVLLEETAGIIKYRQRKEAALSKMEETAGDITRVTDILRELLRQKGPLGIEADKAKTYESLLCSLREAEGLLLGQELRTLEEKSRVLTERQGHVTYHFQETKKAVGEKEAEVAFLEEEQRQTTDRLTATQQEFYENSHKKSEILHQLELHKERLGTLEEKTSALEEEQSKRIGELEALEEKTVFLKANRAEQEESLQRADMQCEEVEGGLLQASSKVRSLKTSLEMHKEGFFSFLQEQVEVRNRATWLTQQVGQKKKQQERLGEERAQRNERLEDSLRYQRELQEEIEREGREVEQLTQSLTAKNTSYSVHLAKQEELQGNYEEAMKDYHKLESKVSTLSSLQRHYEGYNQAVRALLLHRTEEFTLLGTIGDVISVPKGLEIALEIALGGALQYILTPTERDAKGAISWLKEQKKGRVTLLPMDSMVGQFFPESYSIYFQDEGVLGCALDLISFPLEYRDCIAASLGRVAITEAFSDATRLRKRLPSFSRIVTQAGELLAPSGAITGGSTSTKTSGILTRKNELRKLTTSLHEKKDWIQSLEEEKRAVKNEVEGMKEEIEEQKSKMQESQARILTLQGNAKGHAKDILRIQDEILAHKEEEEELKNEIHSLQEEEETTREEILRLEEGEQVKRKRIKEIEQELALEEEKVQGYTRELTDFKVERARILLEVNQYQKEESQMMEDASRLLHEKELGVRKKREYGRQKEQLEAATRSLQREEEVLGERGTTLASTLDTLKEEEERLRTITKSLGEELVTVRDSLVDLQRALHNLELESHRMALEREGRLEELAQREIPYEEAQASTTSKKSSQLKSEIGELKAAISALGMINPAAPLDYQALVARIEFLESQIEDLNEAKEALLEVISEMDTTSKKRFFQTFVKVREEFQILFSQLFQGGRADLVLTDPQELLTTGIDIVAEPPGKKLQNMLLLSGGERSLTAIALLFAIRKIKPTPFCILDEIDAALDESNLRRFSRLMKDFSKKTQFLVITHRQGTMEEAHCMYGITMGDDAVSQLMSVRLAKDA